MKPTAGHFAFAAALATFGSVATYEGSGPALAAESAGCPASPPAELRTQQQAAAAQGGTTSGQSGPDGRVPPSAEGRPPAAGSPPQAVITIAGSDLAATPMVSGTLPAELPRACTAAATGGKITRSRSNIKNNREAAPACAPAPVDPCPAASPTAAKQKATKTRSNIQNN